MVQSQDRPLARYVEHFREQFSKPSFTVGFPLMPTSESMAVGTNPLSEMEMIRG